MHPEIARKLTAQRGCELREQAQRAMVAKMVSRRLQGDASRRRPCRTRPTISSARPAPDYVDGSFLTVSPAGDHAARPAGPRGLCGVRAPWRRWSRGPRREAGRGGR